MAEERLTFGDVTIVVKVSGESTGGAMSVLEEVPPLVDTPLHVHASEDELFYPLEGEHVFQVGAVHVVNLLGVVTGERGFEVAEPSVNVG